MRQLCRRGCPLGSGPRPAPSRGLHSSQRTPNPPLPPPPEPTLAWEGSEPNPPLGAAEGLCHASLSSIAQILGGGGQRCWAGLPGGASQERTARGIAATLWVSSLPDPSFCSYHPRLACRPGWRRSSLGTPVSFLSGSVFCRHDLSGGLTDGGSPGLAGDSLCDSGRIALSPAPQFPLYNMRIFISASRDCREKSNQRKPAKGHHPSAESMPRRDCGIEGTSSRRARHLISLASCPPGKGGDRPRTPSTQCCGYG